MRIRLAGHVLESDTADVVDENARSGVERLQARVFHLVASSHLLHKQQRIRSDLNVLAAVCPRPLERREERPVFRDVVRRSADRTRKFLDKRSVWPLNANAETSRSRITSGPSIDVDRDRAALWS